MSTFSVAPPPCGQLPPPHLNGDHGAAGHFGEVVVALHKVARLVQLARAVLREVPLPGAVKVDERRHNDLRANEHQQAQVVAGQAHPAARLSPNEPRARRQRGEHAQRQGPVDEPAQGRGDQASQQAHTRDLGQSRQPPYR
jgi:hypothetical protein